MSHILTETLLRLSSESSPFLMGEDSTRLLDKNPCYCYYYCCYLLPVGKGKDHISPQRFTIQHQSTPGCATSKIYEFLWGLVPSWLLLLWHGECQRSRSCPISWLRNSSCHCFSISQGKSHEIQRINLNLSSLPKNISNSSLKPYGGGFLSFQMYIWQRNS